MTRDKKQIEAVHRLLCDTQGWGEKHAEAFLARLTDEELDALFSAGLAAGDGATVGQCVRRVLDAITDRFNAQSPVPSPESPIPTPPAAAHAATDEPVPTTDN